MKADPKIATHQLPGQDKLESLIARKSLRTAFQPIVCMENAEVTGFEALARPDKDCGIANPGVLFDMAEEYDRMWALEEVTRGSAFASVEDFPNGILMFTNTTPDVFIDPRFVESIEALVRSVPGLTPSRIVLEITERSGGDDLEAIAQQVAKLKQLGFQIAIDDVGAGTSGLTRIMMLRPHWLKLDRELVADIDKNRYKLNLIRFMVHFARLSGVNVIAEGVERQEELAALINLGVRYVQGFLLGKPMHGYQRVEPELAQWIKTRWAESQSGRGDDPRCTTLDTLSQPVEQAQMTAPLKDLAVRMLKHAHTLGVAVQDGKRLVGWCSRDSIMAAARRADANLPIGFISSADLGTLPPTATIGEALELLSSREDQYLADPVILAENDEIVGVVTLRRLLSASVGETRLWSGLASNLTGLPGKVAAEKRIKTLITRRNGAVDAAFIDVRHFSDYNGAYGYDMGDRLIQDVGALLRTHLSTGDEEAFIAHMGDDRFLVTGTSGVLEQRLRKLIDGFEAILATTPAWTLQSPGVITPQPADMDVIHRLGLRVLLMPGVFTSVQTPRQLNEREAAMRQRLTAQGTARSAVRSVMVNEADQYAQKRRSA
jgi:EAL domain-containing protein (putative c-di-GMP-specific phosphodiesterase class I)/GGDEF domain-containing protein